MELITNADDAHDPYAATIDGIKKALAFGFEHDGGMSETEYETLKKVQDLLHQEDPLLSP